MTGIQRLRSAFSQGKVLVPYITCGDPDLAVTAELLPKRVTVEIDCIAVKP